MPIKTKDGKHFKLSSPNPIVVNQNIWNDKSILYNKFGKKTLDQEIKKETIVAPEIPKIERNLVRIWCLPAFYEDTQDELYGEEYSKIKYGEKFQFDGEIVEYQDLYIRILCDIPIEHGSIIFPKNRDRRWWKVVGNEGNILNCVISEYQPSFG